MNYDQEKQYSQTASVSECKPEQPKHEQIVSAVLQLVEIEIRLAGLCARVNGDDPNIDHELLDNQDPSLHEVLTKTPGEIRQHSQRMHQALSTLESLLF